MPAALKVRGRATLGAMDAAALNESFGIPGVLRFEEEPAGMVRARVSSAACEATVYLHGAHLTDWQPAGERPVLFLSERAVFSADTSIRGGVPVIFPWFGARQWAADGSPRTGGPQHGFARTSTWDVTFAAVAGEDVHLAFALGPSEKSRAAGYDRFRLAYELVLGRTLVMRLSVANESEGPLRFEEALHAYFAVGDVEQVGVAGLGGAEFLDKTEGFRRKRQEDELLTLHGETDRVYPEMEAAVTVQDSAWRRRLMIRKRGSKSTVVWNPAEKLAGTLADLGADQWRGMLCVEAGNVLADAITLRPGEVATIEATVAVEAIG